MKIVIMSKKIEAGESLRRKSGRLSRVNKNSDDGDKDDNVDERKGRKRLLNHDEKASKEKTIETKKKERSKSNSKKVQKEEVEELSEDENDDEHEDIKDVVVESVVVKNDVGDPNVFAGLDISKLFEMKEVLSAQLENHQKWIQEGGVLSSDTAMQAELLEWKTKCKQQEEDLHKMENLYKEQIKVAQEENEKHRKMIQKLARENKKLKEGKQKLLDNIEKLHEITNESLSNVILHKKAAMLQESDEEDQIFPDESMDLDDNEDTKQSEIELEIPQTKQSHENTSQEEKPPKEEEKHTEEEISNEETKEACQEDNDETFEPTLQRSTTEDESKNSNILLDEECQEETSKDDDCDDGEAIDKAEEDDEEDKESNVSVESIGRPIVSTPPNSGPPSSRASFSTTQQVPLRPIIPMILVRPGPQQAFRPNPYTYPYMRQGTPILSPLFRPVVTTLPMTVPMTNQVLTSGRVQIGRDGCSMEILQSQSNIFR